MRYATLLILLTLTIMGDEKDFAFANFKNDKGELDYRIYKPADFDSSKSYSLTISFHGSSAKGRDNKAQRRQNRGPMDIKNYIKKHKLNAILIVPQCRPSGQWVNTPWYGRSHTMD